MEAKVGRVEEIDPFERVRAPKGSCVVTAVVVMDVS